MHDNRKEEMEAKVKLFMDHWHVLSPFLPISAIFLEILAFFFKHVVVFFFPFEFCWEIILAKKIFALGPNSSVTPNFFVFFGNFSPF